MEGHCSTGQSPQWAVVPMEVYIYIYIYIYTHTHTHTHLCILLHVGIANKISYIYVGIVDTIFESTD